MQVRCCRIALLVGALTAAARAGDIEHRLTVRVVDHAQVPRGVLDIANLRAQAIFETAGIATGWRTSLDSGQPEPRQDCHVVVEILPQPVSSLRKSEAFGSAVLFSGGRPGAVAYVFYDRVSDAAKRSRGFSSRLLAHVMVHETAHLLGLGHSSRGMMRASWTEADLRRASTDRLTFTESERRQLRAAIAARQVARSKSR